MTAVATLHGLTYSEAALAFLQSLPNKIRGQVKRKIDALIQNPNPAGCCLVKGMSDGPDKVWRIRSGDYRVLYVVRNPDIFILDIDHRKDVYRP